MYIKRGGRLSINEIGVPVAFQAVIQRERFRFTTFVSGLTFLLRGTI